MAWHHLSLVPVFLLWLLSARLSGQSTTKATTSLWPTTTAKGSSASAVLITTTTVTSPAVPTTSPPSSTSLIKDSTTAAEIRNTTVVLPQETPSPTCPPAAAADTGRIHLILSMGLTTSLNVTDRTLRDMVLEKLHQELYTKFPCARFSMKWLGEQRR
ncbi:uncharacterized protein LOC128350640 [Hemicordylus capensis]|uniref:uncharacterized protein LOC128350640 n=1 Tax=Hemicordylus capensis TaxID=884348 RepID=UPI002304CAF0|nr:uncharacterized protein LOC128350640 [Hemicordylus capensis]